MKPFFSIFALLTLLTSLHASEPHGFQAGDRWCAVGDSITHAGTYHSNIYLFYVTRFPAKRFETDNCGVSGDTAEGTLKRLQPDILSQKPTVASIMLGMNDVGRFSYGRTCVGDKYDKQRNSAINRYVANMRELATKLKARGVRLIFVTPSTFDQTVVLSKKKDDMLVGPNGLGVNTGLGIMADHVRKMAAEFDGQLVDFHAPMTKLNAQQQKNNPAFTLIGRDRVHPGPTGHLVMAYLFLKAQGAPTFVNRIVIDALAGKTEEVANGTIKDFKASSNHVLFTFTSNALPYPTGPNDGPALKLVPFMQELNREHLQVKGLNDGIYELVIDGAVIQAFTAKELATGINLAELANTPQHKQAATVKQINTQRSSLISSKLRSIVYVEQNHLNGVKIDPNNMNGLKTILDERVAKQQGKSWHGYVKKQCEDYLKYKPEEAATHRRIKSLTDQMWEAAMPKAHAYTIRPHK